MCLPRAWNIVAVPEGKWEGFCAWLFLIHNEQPQKEKGVYFPSQNPELSSLRHQEVSGHRWEVEGSGQREWVSLGNSAPTIWIISDLIYAPFHIVPTQDGWYFWQMSQQAAISRLAAGSCRFRKTIKNHGKVKWGFVNLNNNHIVSQISEIVTPVPVPELLLWWIWITLLIFWGYLMFALKASLLESFTHNKIGSFL